MSNEVLCYDDRPEYQKGLFFAHVIECKGRQVGKGGKIVYNPTFRVAPEAAEQQNVQIEGDEPVSGAPMVGVELEHAGIWLDPKPEKPGDNYRYQVQLEAMGMTFGKKEVTVNGQKKSATILTEPSAEILGNPVLIQVEDRWDSRDKDKPLEERRFYKKVVAVMPWSDGQPLDLLAERYADSDGDDEYGD